MGLVRLGISNPSANTATTIFTSDNQYLVSVVATNKSLTTSANIRVWVQPSGSSTESQYAYMIYDFPIDQQNSYETFRFAVNQNDLVRVYASTANVSFSAYGIIQYDIKLGAGISSYSPTAPLNPVDGMIWVDSDAVVVGNSSKPAYVYSAAETVWKQFGSINKTVPYQNTAPASAALGDLWVDNTIVSSPVLKAYDGTSWIITGSSVSTNDRDLIISQRMFA